MIRTGQTVSWMPAKARRYRTGTVTRITDTPDGLVADVQRRETTRTGGSIVRTHRVWVRNLQPARP
jgi:hypothetical protein